MNYGAAIFVAILITLFFAAPVVFLLAGAAVLVHAALTSDTSKPTTTPKVDVLTTVRRRPATTAFTLAPRTDHVFISPAQRKQYLNSSAWKLLRQQVIARDKVCQLTGDTDHLEVHHIHYDNYGNELLEELVLLSRRAHQFVHDYYGSYEHNNSYPVIPLKGLIK
jgi:5-methylcytosine-specific restriction endonuclease McrA